MLRLEIVFFVILSIHKPSLLSCEVPHKMLAPSVQPFWRVLITNGQTDKQAKYKYRCISRTLPFTEYIWGCKEFRRTRGCSWWKSILCSPRYKSKGNYPITYFPTVWWQWETIDMHLEINIHTGWTKNSVIRGLSFVILVKRDSK